MFRNVISCSTLLALVSLGLAENLFVPGNQYPNCPSKLQYIGNFDLARFQGPWYVQYLSYDVSTEGCDGGCKTVYHTLNFPNRILGNFCCQKQGSLYCDESLGSGSLNNYSATFPGNLIYSTLGNDYQAFILDSDYDNKFLGLTCGVLPCGTPYQAIFAYSRTPVPGPSFSQWVYDLLAKNGLPCSLAIPITQGDSCNYSFGCSPRPTTTPAPTCRA